MNIKILITANLLLFPCINALGNEPICDGGSCTKATWNDAIGMFVDCDGSTCKCVNAQTGTSTYSCGCASDSECSSGQYCHQGTCETCGGCNNCSGDTGWVSGNTGYQYRQTKYCLCETCHTSTSYRCATGYYGSSSNGTSGCTRCPSEDGATGTSAAGSTARTSCYIPSGTKFSNNTGSGQWTGNSFYCD